MDRSEIYRISGDVWMIPCRINQTDLTFRPIFRPDAESQTEKKLKNKWSQKEDEELKNIANKRTKKSWSSIAKEFNILLYKGTPHRTGKQCRERWMNHLKPNLLNSEWSKEEDLVLYLKQKELGNKWSKISKFLFGRTESQVKNRWKSLSCRGFPGICLRNNEKIGLEKEQLKTTFIPGIDECDPIFCVKTSDNTPKDFESDKEIWSCQKLEGFSVRSEAFAGDKNFGCDCGLELEEVKFGDLLENSDCVDFEDYLDFDFSKCWKDRDLDLDLYLEGFSKKE